MLACWVILPAGFTVRHAVSACVQVFALLVSAGTLVETDAKGFVAVTRSSGALSGGAGVPGVLRLSGGALPLPVLPLPVLPLPRSGALGSRGGRRGGGGGLARS